MTFKKAEPSDLPVLMRLMQEFHEFDHTEPFDEAPAKMAMENVMSDERVGLVWLIRSSGEDVGYIVLTLHYRLESRGTCANLDELFINEANRGQGIGSKAMEFLENTCRDHGVAVMQLEVKKDNPEAASLYEKAGFEILDRDFMLKNIAT
ncbi:MAG: GNAT family N-acetyltransferase [Gammaproteobacteria bacterium]|nr:GNAT family N-acetyltransferase [Gammaproteobacteria bacterium]